jgi:hypothetical protein
VTGPGARQRARAAAPAGTRVEATATCLSWIPPRAVEGVFKLPFGLGVAHYDKPPPDSAPDVARAAGHGSVPSSPQAGFAR